MINLYYFSKAWASRPRKEEKAIGKPLLHTDEMVYI